MFDAKLCGHHCKPLLVESEVALVTSAQKGKPFQRWSKLLDFNEKLRRQTFSFFGITYTYQSHTITLAMCINEVNKASFDLVWT